MSRYHWLHGGTVPPLLQFPDLASLTDLPNTWHDGFSGTLVCGPHGRLTGSPCAGDYMNYRGNRVGTLQYFVRVADVTSAPEFFAATEEAAIVAGYSLIGRLNPRSRRELQISAALQLQTTQALRKAQEDVTGSFWMDTGTSEGFESLFSERRKRFTARLPKTKAERATYLAELESWNQRLRAYRESFTLSSGVGALLRDITFDWEPAVEGKYWTTRGQLLVHALKSVTGPDGQMLWDAQVHDLVVVLERVLTQGELGGRDARRVLLYALSRLQTPPALTSLREALQASPRVAKILNTRAEFFLTSNRFGGEGGRVYRQLVGLGLVTPVPECAHLLDEAG